MKLSYDELYGIDIDEYCIAHDTTLDEIIKKSQIDITILKTHLVTLMAEETHRFKAKIRDREGILSGHINTILMAIKKKQEHIERMKDWQAGI